MADSQANDISVQNCQFIHIDTNGIDILYMYDCFYLWHQKSFGAAAYCTSGWIFASMQRICVKEFHRWNQCWLLQPLPFFTSKSMSAVGTCFAFNQHLWFCKVTFSVAKTSGFSKMQQTQSYLELTGPMYITEKSRFSYLPRNN